MKTVSFRHGPKPATRPLIDTDPTHVDSAPVFDLDDVSDLITSTTPIVTRQLAYPTLADWSLSASDFAALDPVILAHVHAGLSPVDAVEAAVHQHTTSSSNRSAA